MSKLETIQIDASPEAVSDLLTRGSLHSHQDGAWRYSPWNGETVYVNDPTEQFTERREFPNKREASVFPALGLYAVVHSDGTRGVRRFDPKLEPMVWQLYGPKDEGERALRAWLADKLQRAA